jgi:DNA topoisomerase-1
MQTFRIKAAPMLCFGKTNGHFTCKFNRIAKLAANYTGIAKKLDTYIGTGKMSERSMAALAVKIMMHTGIRVGNEDSAEGYVSKRTKEVIQTFGLTTLKREHVKVGKGKVRLEFLGKRAVDQNITITDATLCKQIERVYKQCKANTDFLPVSDYEVRKFVSKSIGKGFKPKDFRTLYANQLFSSLHVNAVRQPSPKTKSAAKKELAELIAQVASHLGNTPPMTKRAYLDARLIDHHLLTRYNA